MGLEIEGTREEQFAIVKTAVKAHDASLYGNGQPGLMDFMSATKGQFRLLIILITAIGVLVAILAFLEGNREYHSGILPLASHQSEIDATNHHVSNNTYEYASFERSPR